MMTLFLRFWSVGLQGDRLQTVRDKLTQLDSDLELIVPAAAKCHYIKMWLERPVNPTEDWKERQKIDKAAIHIVEKEFLDVA